MLTAPQKLTTIRGNKKGKGMTPNDNPRLSPLLIGRFGEAVKRLTDCPTYSHLD